MRNRIVNNRLLQLGLMLAVGLALGWMFFSGSAGHTHGDSAGSSEEAKIYTCSMHPQIRQDGPGKCPLCGMDLIPLTRSSGSGPANPYVHSMSPEAVALANIQTVKIDYLAPGHEISLSGKIAVNEQNLAVITANFSGRIERLFIDFTGQQVSKGQKLATIYSPELITAQKELLEAARNRDANPVLYNAVREKLRLWKIGDKQIAAIEAAGDVKPELDIYSDVAGVVIKRGFSTGDFVNRGSALFEIADLSKVWVLLDAYESDIPLIRVGEKVTFTVASIPGREFTSAISFVDPLVNPQTRTAAVRAEIANPGMVLKPDMFINAKVKSGISFQEKTLLIPKSALLWTGTRSVVYVEITDSEFPAFEMREITLGSRTGEFYSVSSGLNPGDKVVVNGVFAIDAAAQLSGNYSMMNRPASLARNIPAQFTLQLTEVVEAYLEVKNALVESDGDKAGGIGKRLLSTVKRVGGSHLQGDALSTWKEQEKQIQVSVENLIKAKDLKEKRNHFEMLSNSLIAAVEFFGVNREGLFLNHCPMAANDTGAYWLSEFEAIKNPYYGAAMLQCGDIERKIPPIGTAANNDIGTQPVHRH